VAGTEPLAVGLEDEHLDVVVVVGTGERLVHVPHLPGGLDVGLLRGVQDDAGHRSVLLVDDRLELHSFHGSLPSARPPPRRRPKRARCYDRRATML